MAPELMFVQFPHPGAEHQPAGLLMDWNRREHARKFLKATGRYLAHGAVQSGPFTYWGEWEPQSRVLESYRPQDARPRWLHEPLWERPRHRALLQNTDPLVLGDHFLYSNCRQSHNSKLRRLAPGSIVLFGSKLNRAFVLDTVFVVGDRGEPFTRASAGQFPYDDWIQAVVFEPLSAGSGGPEQTYRLYEGRTYDEAPNGPFSFVPCRPYRPGTAGFARPTVRLDERWIKPNLAMGARATPASQPELLTVWQAIAGQVVESGLALGIALDPPGLLNPS